MGENEDEKQTQAGQIFENFVQASTCKGTLQAFNILTRHLDLDPLDHRNFYSKLKSKVTTWKAKALWYKLDKRGSHKEYKRGKSCMNTKVREPLHRRFLPCGACGLASWEVRKLLSLCHRKVLSRCGAVLLFGSAEGYLCLYMHSLSWLGASILSWWSQQFFLCALWGTENKGVKLKNIHNLKAESYALFRTDL